MKNHAHAACLAVAILGLTVASCSNEPGDDALPSPKPTPMTPTELPPGVIGSHTVLPEDATEEDERAAHEEIINHLIEDDTVPAYVVEREAYARGVEVNMEEVIHKKEAQGAPTT